MTGANAYTRPAVDRILWATDFSDAADRALAYAIGIAKHYDATLVAGHVTPGTYPLLPAEAPPDFEYYSGSEAEEELTALMASDRLEGVRTEVTVVEGDMPESMLRMVADESIDLVVAGTHGRSGWKRLVLGSVAEQLFRRVGCPVLTVGPGAEPPLPPETEFRHILFPTDFRPEAQQALNWALSLAQEHQADLTLLYVVEKGFRPMEEADRMGESIRRQLSALVPEEVRSWCDAGVEVQFGDAAGMILASAEKHGTDLIVLGVRPPRVGAGRTPWTTAHRIVREARCPVLTVRGGAPDQG